MSAATAMSAEPHRARFARRSTRGVLLGLTLPRIVALLLAGLVFVPAIFTAALEPVLVTAPIWGSLLASAYVPLAGRKAVEWVPLVGHWLVRRAAGQTRYRAPASKPRPEGTLALPGDTAALRLLSDPITGAAMIHDPHAHTLTAVVQVTHDAFVLLDPEDQDRRAEAWGRLKAACCLAGRHLCRIQTLERTLPDTGVASTAYWHAHGVQNGSWYSQAYAELLADARPDAERHDSVIAISLDLKGAARDIRALGGGLRGATVLLRQEMARFAAGLRDAELTPTGWLDPTGIALWLREAYDPAATPFLDETELGRDTASAGPLAVEEEWSCLRADSAWHAVLWIAEWPRTAVDTGFLWPLLLTNGIRRTVSVTYEPVPSAKALRDVRTEQVEQESDQRMRDKHDVMTTRAQRVEAADVDQREDELITGHGDMRFAGLATVTADSRDDLSVKVNELIDAGVAARCELRVLWGEQGAGFAAAALPLGKGL